MVLLFYEVYMKVEFLTNELESVINLINEVFNTSGNVNTFSLLDSQKMLLLKDDDKVIGTCLITLKNDPIKNTKTYYLDYFCIKKEYEHKGLGTFFFNKIVEIALENNIDYIELTSKKERVRAREMYLKQGMNIKDTDVFIKEL